MRKKEAEHLEKRDGGRRGGKVRDGNLHGN